MHQFPVTTVSMTEYQFTVEVLQDSGLSFEIVLVSCFKTSLNWKSVAGLADRFHFLK